MYKRNIILRQTISGLHWKISWRPPIAVAIKQCKSGQWSEFVADVDK